MWESASSPFGTSTSWCPQLQSKVDRPGKLRRYQQNEDLVWKAEGKGKHAASGHRLTWPNGGPVKEMWQWNSESELFVRIDKNVLIMEIYQCKVA